MTFNLTFGLDKWSIGVFFFVPLFDFSNIRYFIEVFWKLRFISVPVYFLYNSINLQLLESPEFQAVK